MNKGLKLAPLFTGEDPREVAERVRRILNKDGARAVALSEEEAPTRRHAEQIAAIIGPGVRVTGGRFEGEDFWIEKL